MAVKRSREDDDLLEEKDREIKRLKTENDQLRQQLKVAPCAGCGMCIPTEPCGACHQRMCKTCADFKKCERKHCKKQVCRPCITKPAKKGTPLHCQGGIFCADHVWDNPDRSESEDEDSLKVRFCFNCRTENEIDVEDCLHCNTCNGRICGPCVDSGPCSLWCSKCDEPYCQSCAEWEDDDENHLCKSCQMN